MMAPAELWRVRMVFGALAVVPLFLAGWLGYVQVLQAAELPRGKRAPLHLVPSTADAQGATAEKLPNPRGTIVDRDGNPLAIDRAVYEVRARITVPKRRRASVGLYLQYLADTVDGLARTLVADPELAQRSAAEQLRKTELVRRFAAEFKTKGLVELGDPATTPLPEAQPLVGEVLLVNGLDSLAVIEALRELDRGDDFLRFDFLRSFERCYPEREVTHGLVGHLETVCPDGPGGSQPATVVGVCGLETNPALQPAPAGARPFRNDGLLRPYFLGAPAANRGPAVVHATIDLDLQRAASRELQGVADELLQDGKTLPQWAALVLVEVDSGDVLAAASWHRDAKHQQGSAWTPYQSLYEPGSVVKPLVFAQALHHGVLDWSQIYDCAPGSAEYRERIGGAGRSRPVRDDHDCQELDAHGILVRSSNIGAAYVGLGLERDQWRDYFRRYGFGSTLGFGLPYEGIGGHHKRSFASDVTPRSFRANSAISFSFGYELQVTALQMARAYLRLFRGDGSQLRLCRGTEVDGTFTPAPASPIGERYDPRVVDLVRGAMVDVVSDDEHSTGVHLHRRMLKDLSIDLHGVIGGKTGTAVSRVGGKAGKTEVRNASFVGFLPAEAPRWLAVAILQRDDRAHFYGGNYAAPPVVRLLLQAQRQAERRLLHQDMRQGGHGQVTADRGSPGESGWSPGAPETSLVGR